MATGTLDGVDFSGQPPNYAEVLADHPRFLFCKYLSHTSWKEWAPAEIKLILGKGGRVGLLIESTAARAIETSDDYGAGYADALAAIDQARALIAAVGIAPRNRIALIFAVDLDVPRTRRGEVGNYFRGVAAGFAHRNAHGQFKIGVYGSIAILKYLRGLRLVEVTFLTYAWLYGFAPSRADADLYQWRNGQPFYGGLVDYDQVNNPTNLGMWCAPGDPLNVPEADLSDLMEVISNMDGAPTTYAQFLDDVEARVAKQNTASRILIRQMIAFAIVVIRKGWPRGWFTPANVPDAFTEPPPKPAAAAHPSPTAKHGA